MDAAAYRTGLETLRYPADVVTLQLELLAKRKTPTVEPVSREASRAMWDTWYSEGIKTGDEYRATLEKLDYDLETVSSQLALLDIRKTTTQRDLLQSEAPRAFKEQVIDETTYRARLEALGRPPDAIDILPNS